MVFTVCSANFEEEIRGWETFSRARIWSSADQVNAAVWYEAPIKRMQLTPPMTTASSGIQNPLDRQDGYRHAAYRGEPRLIIDWMKTRISGKKVHQSVEEFVMIDSTRNHHLQPTGHQCSGVQSRKELWWADTAWCTCSLPGWSNLLYCTD